MPSCTLEIGGLVVATAEEGPFEVEYALFEAHEIELRSNNEPGTVREHGYETTVDQARERLESQGVTLELAELAANEMGALVTSYARGPEVRRVASLLRACELFEGHTWMASTKRYQGGWLEVAALAADTGVEEAERALQALHLAALLHDARGDATVFLGTAGYSAGRKPGARSHRRVSLDSAANIIDGIRALGERRGPRTTREGGATRSELLDAVRTRLAMCANAGARSKLEGLARALAARERPQRGPLADVDLWAIEIQLDEGDTSDAKERLDAVERSRGRAPGSAYLRARLALMVGEGTPREIAERASSLALSMSAFPELELLAAEAWTRAGELKRATAYARVLAENPQVEVALRDRARALVFDPPPVSIERPPSVAPSPPSSRASVAPVSSARISAPPSSTPSSGRPSSPSAPALVAITTGTRASFIPARAPTAAPPPPPAEREDDPFDQDERDTPIEPAPIVGLRGPSSPSIVPTPIVEVSRRVSAAPPPEAPPTSPSPVDERLEAQRSPTRPSMRAPSASQLATTPSGRPAPVPHLDDESEPALPEYAKGGSQPPFRTEPPPLDFPAEPIVPRQDGDRVERAETLSLPDAFGSEAPPLRPADAREARVYFTHQTRELGRLYRTRFNVELRTDVRSIEIVQRHLAERFEKTGLTSAEDVDEVRMHGAFLSEVLARRLGAEWVDLAASEPGYLAMNVPPGTRIWPIGRVIRFVTMRHRERDLVSYFLELQARAHGLR